MATAEKPTTAANKSSTYAPIIAIRPAPSATKIMRNTIAPITPQYSTRWR